MKVLITGAAGFIGSHIAERYRDVVGIDNLATGRAKNFAGELHVADIADELPDVRPDVIFHCAGSYTHLDFETDARTNVMGTINVVRLAQRTGAKIVYLQTSLCYGGHATDPVPVTQPLDPHGSYGWSKTAGEGYVRASGVPWVSLRLANIYGPRGVMGPVPAFWKRLSEGRECVVVDSRRDFLFIDDLVDLAVVAAERGHGIYHAANGRDWPIMEVYREVAKAMATDVPEPRISERTADDAMTILIDPSATEAELGWRAKTRLSKGIARAVNWYDLNGLERAYTHLELVKGNA